MCISLTPVQQLTKSTVITNSFDDVHNITYMTDVNGSENEIGGFIIFTGHKATIIEPPTIFNIHDYQSEVLHHYMRGKKYNQKANPKPKTYIPSRTYAFQNLDCFNDQKNKSLICTQFLSNLIDNLESRDEFLDQSFILCLFPINSHGTVAFSYSIQGNLIIPGWENDPSEINLITPYIERQCVYIIGQQSSSQKSQLNFSVPSTFEYCFPSNIACYSEGLEELQNGNLCMNTNQFGWNHLQVA